MSAIAIKEINNWKTDIALIMTLLGKRTIGELIKTDLLIVHDVKEWCLARGIPYEDFANREAL